MNNAIWPLEPYFPGTIAIPIAEALAPDEESESQAINCAIRALNFQHKGSTDRILRRWRRVPVDVALQRYRRRAGLLIAACGLLWGLVMLVSPFGFQALAYREKRTILIRTTAPPVVLSESQFIEQLSASAKTIVQEIETSHPSGVPSWMPNLPWPLNNRPAIPESKVETFQTVKSWASRRVNLLEFGEVVARKDIPAELEGLASPTSVQGLQGAIISLRSHLGTLAEGTLLSFQPSPGEWWWPILLYGLFILLPGLRFPVFFQENPQWYSERKAAFWRVYLLASNPKPVGPWKLAHPAWMVALYSMILMIIITAIPASALAQSRSSTIWVVVFITSIFPPVGLAFARFHWPNNPLLATVNEVLPQTIPLLLPEDADSELAPQAIEKES